VIYSFGSFELDTSRHELRRAGVRVEVEPKAFAVLSLLLENSDRVVSKAELRDAIWPDEAVTEGVLTRSIWAARKAVEDDGNRQEVIRTLHRRGYRFVAALIAEPPSGVGRFVAPTPTPGSAPEHPGAFVGRRAEIRALDDWLDQAMLGRPQIVVIRGEAGVGKTRLLQEFGVLATRRGARLLEGRVPQDSGVPPYWPWRELLRSTLEAADRRELAEQVGDGLAVLSEIFPELRTLSVCGTPAGSGSEAPERLEIYRGIARLLGRLSQSAPLVLLLEDVHWADPSSLMLLRFLQSGFGNARVLIAATFRTFDLHDEDPRAALHRSIVAHPDCGLVDLDGFEREDCARLAELVAGRSLSEAWIEDLCVRSDGLPLVMVELIRFHESCGDLSKPPARTRNTPTRSLATLDRRLDRLSTACLDLLTCAATFGRGFRVDLLARVSPEPEESLLRLLSEAEHAHIIEALVELGGYQFRHALVRDAVYTRATSAERAGLHRQIGHMLARLHADSERPPYAEIVYHLGRSPFHEDQQKVVEYAGLAADAAIRIHSYDEAIAHYRDALGALDRVSPHDHGARRGLLERLATARLGAGDHRGAADAYEQVIDLSRRLDDRAGFRRVVLLLAHTHDRRWAPDDASVARLDRALEGATGEVRARLLERLVYAANLRNDPRVVEWSEEGLGLARALGDPTLILQALIGRHLAQWGPDSLAERLEIDRELLELMDGEKREQIPAVECLWGWLRRALDRLEIGDVEGMERALERATPDPSRLEEDLPPEIQVEQIREHNKLALHGQTVRMNRNTLAILRGNFADAEKEAMRLGAEASELANGDTLIAVQVQIFALRYLQGRSDEVVGLMQRLLEENPGYSHAAHAAVAMLLADLGRTAEARRELDAMARQGLAALSRDMFFLSTLTLIAEASFLADHSEQASQYYALLAPFHDRLSMAAVAYCTGSVSRGLGMLATLDRDYAAAERHFEFALEQNARLGARPFHASSAQAYAQMLAQRDAAGDAAKRRSLARLAVEEARALGMPHLEARARALAG